MIPEKEREALMRLTMCARNECVMCKYKDSCDSDVRFEFATKHMNILADALRKTEPTISKMEQVDKDINVRSKDEPITQMKTQNSNLTFEKDECAKEYEELGLKELKELIEADRKTENSSEKPNNCKYAENPSGDVWECGCFLDTYCEHQIYDRNPDGTINIVECGYEPKDEPQTDCAWRKGE